MALTENQEKIAATLRTAQKSFPAGKCAFLVVLKDYRDSCEAAKEINRENRQSGNKTRIRVRLANL